VWLFIFPTGMIFALCKRQSKENKAQGSASETISSGSASLERTFFVLHASTQVIGIVLFFIALYFALIYNRWPTDRFITNHRFYGYIIVGCTSLQIISVFFSPLKLSYWYPVHRWLGLMTVVFAWCNILPGLVEIGAPTKYLYAHGIIIAFWIIIYFAVNWYLKRWRETTLKKDAKNFGVELESSQKWYSTFPRQT